LIAVGGPVAFLGIGIAVAWVIAVQLVAATLTGILQIALYRFANDGAVPGFDNDKLKDMFRPRGSRGGMGGLGRFGGGGAAGGGFTGGGFGGPTSPN
jgi:uncharacterized membrane protein YgcG